MDPELLEEVVGRMLRRGHAWLRAQRPAIAAELDPPATV